MVEDLRSWFQEELEKRGITLTEQDYQEIIRKLEEREWISAQPELELGKFFMQIQLKLGHRFRVMFHEVR